MKLNYHQNKRVGIKTVRPGLARMVRSGQYMVLAISMPQRGDTMGGKNGTTEWFSCGQNRFTT